MVKPHEVEILLVEDNPGDINLYTQGFKKAQSS